MDATGQAWALMVFWSLVLDGEMWPARERKVVAAATHTARLLLLFEF